MPAPQATPITVTLPTPLDEAGRGIWGGILNTALGVITTAINFLLSLFGMQGVVYLDSFAGANDDAKLTAALSYVSGLSYRPAIAFSNRAYTFTTKDRAPFNGLRLIGPTRGLQAPERNGGASDQAFMVNLNFNGNWFTATTASIFQVYLGQMCFKGTTGNEVVLGNTGSGTWYCLDLEDISASGLKGVCGTYAAKLLGTAGVLRGNWDIANGTDCAINLGGSDWKLLFTQALVDSPTGSCPSAGRPVALYLQSLDKTPVTGLYVTCRGAWSGVEIDGPTNLNNGSSSNFGTVWISHSVIEGQNPVYSAGSTYPAYGGLIKVKGGRLSLSHSWLAYAMYDPANGGSPTAVIDVTGGNFLMYDCVYDRAAAVSEDVYLVNASGGTTKVRIRDMDTASRGGAWTGTPKVLANGGSVTADSTVTVVDGTVKQSTFEGGTATVTVTTGNSGGVSGDPFAYVDSGFTFDADSFKGSVSMKCDGTSTTTRRAYWDTSPSRLVAARFYFKLDSTPTGGTRIAAFATAGDTNQCAILIDTARKLSLQNAAGTTLSTTTNGLVNGTWYRVELTVDNAGGSGAGAAVLNVYAGDSLSADANLSLTAASANFGTSNIARLALGRWSGGSAVSTYKFDDVKTKAGSTSLLGPS
jgi:hypothetical protein